MRWTPADVEAYQARQVSPNGDVSRQPVPTKALVSKRAKYGNKRTVVDGISFDSLAEARRFGELKLMKAAGEIADLQVHPKFSLEVLGDVIGTYEADFSYLDLRTTQIVTEDVKGGQATKTQLYRWKRRHLKAQYGIDIAEITS